MAINILSDTEKTPWNGPSSQGAIPLGTIVVDAKTADSTMLLKPLDYLKQMEIELSFLIADMGYIDDLDKMTAFTKYHTAVITEVR